MDPNESSAVEDDSDRIRNVSIVADSDAAVASLMDLLERPGARNAGTSGAPTSRQQHRSDGPFRSVARSFPYERSLKDPTDSSLVPERAVITAVNAAPQHVAESSAAVVRALRITDGLLIAVDCAEGLTERAEALLRRALSERIRPVVFVDNIAPALLPAPSGTQTDQPGVDAEPTTAVSPEDLYQHLLRIIEKVNTVVATFADPAMGDASVDPSKGTVVFGSSSQGWAFGLRHFARLYKERFGADEASLCGRLWGDHFYDAKAKAWTARGVGQGGSKLRRAFCEFCLEPLCRLFGAVVNRNMEALQGMLPALGIPQRTVAGFSAQSRSPLGVLKDVMAAFLPAGETLLDMIVTCLPSARAAQQYRTELLYEDLTGTASAEQDPHVAGTERCDSDAPLIFYAAQLVPANGKSGRLLSLGRVFSGTVRTGRLVKIYSPDFNSSCRTSLFMNIIDGCVRVSGISCDSVPCGSICALEGIDKYIVSSATICEKGEPREVRRVNSTAEHFVRVSLAPSSAANMSSMCAGVQLLSKLNSHLCYSITSTGEHTIAAATEEELMRALRVLQTELQVRGKIGVSSPVVSYRETVTTRSNQLCLATSTNGHNRLFCRAEPLTEALAVEMEAADNAVAAWADPKRRQRYLVDSFGWDVAHARHIICYGPNESGPNVVVDCTKGVQDMAELHDPLTAAWRLSSGEGVLCGEPLRGVRLNLEDATLVTDAIHRSRAQVIPAARRATFSSCLTAAPRLMEPVFSVTARVTEAAVPGLYAALTHRRGVVVGEEAVATQLAWLWHGSPVGNAALGSGSSPESSAPRPRSPCPLFDITAHVPVAESFGLSADLAAVTGAAGSHHVRFDHWQLVPGDPLVAGSAASDLVSKIRHWKGLSPELRALSTFLDKL